MSAPKPATVLLVLALVAIIAVFVVGVSLGGGDRRVDPKAWKERFLAGPPQVKRAEIEGALCPTLIAASRSCTFEVRGASALVRMLEVRTQDEVEVVLSPSGQERSIPIVLKPARLGKVKKVELAIGRGGAKVEVQCRKPAGIPAHACTVQIPLPAPT